MQLIRPLILASRSPRRLALLRQLGWNPLVLPCDIPEEVDPRLSPEENARTLAMDKASIVAPRVDDGFVLGADTLVAIDGHQLGKPADRNDALRMLALLSGRTHVVCTGIAVIDRPSGRSVSVVESTLVTFRQLPPPEIEEYVDGGSPMDKAGGYGIQDDYGAVFVSRIEGCYYNVVGLPLARVYLTLHNMGAFANGKGAPGG